MHNTHLPDIILFYRGIMIQNEHSRRLFSIINDINLLTRLREAHTVLLKKCFQSRPPSPLPPPPKTINPAISFIINYIYHVSWPCNIPSTDKNSIIRKEQRINYKKITYIKCTQFTSRHDYPSIILYRNLSKINQSKSYIYIYYYNND